MDYNEEIPFEKQPPPGFYDIAEDERDMAPPNFKRMRQQDVQGVRRDNIERVRVQCAIICEEFCE